MVEPAGFVEAWKAQFPDSDPPELSLNSVGDIEQELEKCRDSIRRLEMEVNKERFRMIYLQTLLAKERRSHDSQRWGFSRVSQGEHKPASTDEHHQKADGSRCLPDKMKHTTAAEESHESQPFDGMSPYKNRSIEAPLRPIAGRGPVTTGLGVAALRSNFEHIRRANSQTSGEGKSERPYYVNMEYHHEKGLVRVNDRDVSEKISSLGSQAMQMERKRSLHSVPGNLSTAFGDIRKPERSHERAMESGYNCEYEEPDLNPGFLKDSSSRLNGRRATQQNWHQSECQPYTTVYVGGIMGDGEDLLSVQSLLIMYSSSPTSSCSSTESESERETEQIQSDHMK
uniref:Breakpoint cluster region protein-like n=1 Tax=Sinocyclocheilus grahami TaxID=75366 RepID=A0A672RLM0_SINGR